MDLLPNELRMKLLLYIHDEQLEFCLSLPYFSLFTKDKQFWKERYKLSSLYLLEEENWLCNYKRSLEAEEATALFFKLYKEGRLDRDYLGWIDISSVEDPKMYGNSRIEKFLEENKTHICRLSSEGEEFKLVLFNIRSDRKLENLTLSKEELKNLLYRLHYYEVYVKPVEM